MTPPFVTEKRWAELQRIARHFDDITGFGVSKRPPSRLLAASGIRSSDNEKENDR